MVRRPSPAVFRSKELNELIEGLEPENKLRKWIEDIENVLKENMFAGNSIRKRQIPNYYRERYGVNNLFHYTYPEGYISCYTLLNYEELGVCPLIIDIREHTDYERIFGYEKR